MDSVRRHFFIFCALLVSFNLSSEPKQSFFNSSRPEAFSLFEENGKVGMKNAQGQVVIPAQYESIGWSDGKFSLVGNVTGYRSRGLWGLINIQNSKVTKAEFEDLSPGQGEILVARKKLPGTMTIRSGCISLAGKEIVPFQYDGIQIKSLRAIVYVRSGRQFKHGLIDFENRVLIPLNYQNVYTLGSLRYGVENFENKTAIFSEDGRQLCDFLIDSISNFKKDYAIIYQDQRQGLINRNGEIKIQPSFAELQINDEGVVSSRTSDSWNILGGDNKSIRQITADSVATLGTHLYKITAAGKSQLVDAEFRSVTSDWYSKISAFNERKAVFSSKGKVGLLNDRGQILIKPLYQSLTIDKQAIIAQITTDKRFVLIDSVGRAITPRSYELIQRNNGKFFPVKNRGFWGGVDKSGKEIIACTHDSIGQMMDEHIVVKFKGKYGVINLKEEWVVTPQVAKIELISSERYLLKTTKTKFLKSFKGEVIYFSDNPLVNKNGFLVESLQSGSYLKIDMRGVIAERYENPNSIEALFEEHEGLRAIRKDGRYGFVDNRGRLRIANRYENVKNFSETLAPIMIRGKWGFINHEDQIAIQPVYDQVESFQNGFAIVKLKDYFGLIDKKGKLVVPAKYESIEILDKIIKVKQNGLWGLVNNSGKILLHPKYESLSPLDNGYAIISRDGKYGVVTHEGMSTIPQVYDAIFYDRVHKNFQAVKRSTWAEVSLN